MNIALISTNYNYLIENELIKKLVQKFL